VFFILSLLFYLVDLRTVAFHESITVVARYCRFVSDLCRRGWSVNV